ncbi:MAG: hypothetical protein WD042_20250 [Phycisphaeraceae bacterium]
MRGALAWTLGWMRGHPLAAGVIGLAFTLGAVDFYEVVYDPFLKKFGPFKYALRDDLQTWLALAAAVMGGLGLSAWWAGKGCVEVGVGKIGGTLNRKRWGLWVVVFLVPLVMGAALCLGALEGVPHFSDSLTYLMQGRVLWAHRLYLPAPRHPDLWIHTLFFVTDRQYIDSATASGGAMVYEGTRFFGKYPVGWPAVLGTFDHFGAGFLANAALTGLAALLTGFVARQFTSRRVAVLAGLLLALSPWVWFNGAGFASHVASTCAVMGFLGLVMWVVNLEGRERGSAKRQALLGALGAGLVLGAGVLIRPGDAANFALPVIGLVLVLMVVRPRGWLVLGPVIAVGAMVGVGVYLYSNGQTTGHATMSPYALETRWSEDWNDSPLAMAGRFAFQWAELNGRFPGWGVGGLTVAVVGMCVVIGGRRGGRALNRKRRRGMGLWLLVACTATFFCFNTAFGFTNVWWGPRWLFPVAPLLAILGAMVVDRSMRAARGRGWGRGQALSDSNRTAAGQLALLVLAAGLLVGVGVYAGRWYTLSIQPPHTVSAAAHERAMAMGLTDAVIAMPTGGDRAPLDARAGVVFMNVPFDDNPVIYVRNIADWESKARASFPGRRLYALEPSKDDPSGFVIRELRE